MMRSARTAPFAFAIATLLCASATVSAQTAPAAAAPATQAAAARPLLPADPWPRKVDLANASVLVYQPQVNKWEGNQIDFRAALAIKPVGAKEETFGVIFATARTQVDQVARTVVFEDLKITKSDFPTLPESRRRVRGRAAEEHRQRRAHDRARPARGVARARRGSSRPPVPVQNDPPQVIVSYSPAILVPIDGAPVMKPVPGHSRFQRVINTRALILQGGLGDKFYMHVYDGWLSVERARPDRGRRPSSGRFVRSESMPSRSSSPRPAPSTCSTAAPRPIRSPRSPTACRRSTRRRSRPS